MLVVVPSPSWPDQFPPHVQAIPSFFRAIEWTPPLEIAMTSFSPLTWTGVYRSVVVPSPSWLTAFLPHAQTVPSHLRAIAWAPPAEPTQLPSNGTAQTGRGEGMRSTSLEMVPQRIDIPQSRSAD